MSKYKDLVNLVFKTMREYDNGATNERMIELQRDLTDVLRDFDDVPVAVQMLVEDMHNYGVTDPVANYEQFESEVLPELNKLVALLASRKLPASLMVQVDEDGTAIARMLAYGSRPTSEAVALSQILAEAKGRLPEFFTSVMQEVKSGEQSDPRNEAFLRWLDQAVSAWISTKTEAIEPSTPEGYRTH